MLRCRLRRISFVLFVLLLYWFKIGGERSAGRYFAGVIPLFAVASARALDWFGARASRRVPIGWALVALALYVTFTGPVRLHSSEKSDL